MLETSAAPSQDLLSGIFLWTSYHSDGIVPDSHRISFSSKLLRTYFLWFNCQLYEHCILFSHLLLLLSIQRYSLMDIFAFHFVISILVTAASHKKDSVLPTLLAVPPAVSHIQRESVVPLRTRNIPDIPEIPFPCLDNRH